GSFPVYVVPATTSARPGRILVPLDRPEPSLEVLPFAAALARAFHSGIVLLAVHKVGSESALQRARDLLQGEGVPTETALRPGEPAAQILRACRELGIAAIAIRSGILGSPTVRLLRESPVPLLVVRRQLPSESTGRGPVAASFRPVPTALW